MASRAHVIHDYTFGGRPRRDVRYQDDDPVILPRSSSWSISGGLIAAALTASALIVASVLSISYREAAPVPQLAETPAPPLERPFQPDSQIEQANIIRALNHRAWSVPSVVSVSSLALETDTRRASRPAIKRESQEYVIDDSAPGVQAGVQGRSPQAPETQPLVPEAPAIPGEPQAPYPNPTMTPPEVIAPPNTTPETPTPLLERENPYR